MAFFKRHPVARVARLSLAIVLSLIWYAFQNDAARGGTTLAHSWQGHYYYQDSRAPVPFQWQLQSSGATFTGRSTEPATFGSGSSQDLYANIVGSIKGSAVSFIKRYTGSNGVTHAVEYNGWISADGSTMWGTWRVTDSTGFFVATSR